MRPVRELPLVLVYCSPMPRMLRQLCAVLVLAIGTACGRGESRTVVADTSNGEVAFGEIGRRSAMLLVPVYIDGKGPYQFVLDTGATLTCIDESLAAALGLPNRFGPLGSAAGATQAGQVRLVRIASLRTGNAEEKAIEACVLDLQHLQSLGQNVQGLLGLNFLRDYRVALDFERGVVTFDR
jgi:hypothetical protein